MPYTSNPNMGITRRKAVDDVLTKRRNQAEAARHYGFTRSAVCKWMKRRPKHNRQYIETRSSAPRRCWKQIPIEIEDRVISLRKETGRCAQILYAMLKDSGTTVSLSTVTRILRRNSLTRKKKQLKPPYAKIQRPLPTQPGILVEMDTIHYVRSDGSRFYIYTLIDVCSRYAYAEYSRYLSAQRSVQVVRNALMVFPFKVTTIQTDNGSEFSEEFYFLLKKLAIRLRHTRIRRPNDNAHVERFVRTVQEEGFKGIIPNEAVVKIQLDKFIRYYNTNRYHLGINCNTPCYFVSKLMN
jgi:transposase InsO family protein